MNRLPPELVYLVIYNPTLKQDPGISDDDEDAAEQAHILFYTAKQQAVSRDTMLRQVGLAKALVGFSNMFDDGECKSAHSQSRRMVMVSPESGYWIHACLEHAKSVRPAKDKGKTTTADSTNAQSSMLYDHHYGSVQDNAVRSYLLQGYEAFKLTHGTFASILEARGQQVLELQLERFFTVWAWKWDTERDFDFGANIGIPLHALHHTLTPTLDAIELPTSSNVSFVLSSSYLIPSSRFTQMRYPHALLRYLLVRFPPPVRPPPSRRSSSNGKRTRVSSSSTVQGVGSSNRQEASRLEASTLKLDQKSRKPKPSHKNPSSEGGSGSTLNFLTMPNMSMNMDVRKWTLGYLSFGKNPGKSQKETSSAEDKGDLNPSHDAWVTAVTDPHQPSTLQHRGPQVEVNTEELEDAMSTRSAAVGTLAAGEMSSSTASQSTDATSSGLETNAYSESTSSSVSVTALDSEVASSAAESTDDRASVSLSELDKEPVDDEASKITSTSQSQVNVAIAEDDADSLAPVAFSTATLFLPRNMHDRTEERKRVFFFNDLNMMFAFVTDVPPDGGDGGFDEETLMQLSKKAQEALRTIEKTASVDPDSHQASVPSINNILQPKDRFIASASQSGEVYSSPGFSSISSNLYEAKRLLEEQDIVEVFSRGQNPQHWHIARNGLGVNKVGSVRHGQVFMEVFRREASLTDVDNDINAVVKRLIE